MSLKEITAAAPLDFDKKSKAVLLFGASWHEACAPLEQILTALAASTGQDDDVYFAKVDAEAVHELSDQYQVESVPTILTLLLNHTDTAVLDVVLERLEGGVDPSQVTVAVQRLLAAPSSSSGGGGSSAPTATTTTTTTTTVDPEQALKERLDTLIRRDAVMLFMKGKPDAPKCGFSRQAVELLEKDGVAFGSFDILSDETVRQGLKTHSNWPTYPQIYVKGELQGGLDIMKEMAEEGSLKEQWGLTDEDGKTTTTTTSNSLDARLKELTTRSKVMVFMKGLPSAPKCGFSRQLIEMLDDAGAAYDAFDILSDEDVRQGLKAFSNWPTYPQLYVNGDLVGGLDICKELQESGEFQELVK